MVFLVVAVASFSRDQLGEKLPGLPDVLTFLKNISNKSNIMPQRIKIELF